MQLRGQSTPHCFAGQSAVSLGRSLLPSPPPTLNSFPSFVHSLTSYSFSSSPFLVCTRRKEESCMRSRLSRVWLFATLWTIAHQAPLSMRFSRQEYWSRLLCPPPGDLPNPGNQTHISYSPGLTGGFFTTSATWEAPKRRDQTLKNEIRLAPSPGHA